MILGVLFPMLFGRLSPMLIGYFSPFLTAHNLRTHDNHSNKDIDPSKSGDNIVLYDLDYHATVKKLYDRLAEIDQTNTNKRKDRVEMIEATIPYPREWQKLTREQQIEWGMGVIHYMQKQFGKANVIQAVIHYDEIHNYIDPKTNQITTSRPHIHIDIVPEKDGKLICKDLTSKKNLQNRNEAIDKWTRQQFGIVWKTGEYKKDTPKKSVEELKVASANLADIQRSQERAAAARQEAEQAEIERDNTIVAMQADIEQTKKDVTEIICLTKQDAQKQIQQIQERIRQSEIAQDEQYRKVQALAKHKKQIEADYHVQKEMYEEIILKHNEAEKTYYEGQAYLKELYAEIDATKQKLEELKKDKRLEKAFAAAQRGEEMVRVDDWIK